MFGMLKLEISIQVKPGWLPLKLPRSLEKLYNSIDTGPARIDPGFFWGLPGFLPGFRPGVGGSGGVPGHGFRRLLGPIPLKHYKSPYRRPAVHISGY